MAVPPREPRLSKEQRGVLTLLASIPHGVAEELVILAHGFDRAMIAGLVHRGLAREQREVSKGSNRALIEVVRIGITDAGRTALEV
jgi:hypothetical protein